MTLEVHKSSHPLAGKTVTLKNGAKYRVEDWADRVLGESVWRADGNPAALKYAIRRAKENLPIDENTLYGKCGPFGEIIHCSEIAEES